MTTMLDLSDGCPRCGGALEVMSSTTRLNCAVCPSFWPDVKGWQRECVARDIAGTRKTAVGPEYVTDGRMKTEVEELVDLVQYMAYENVMKNIRLAIEGRNTDAYKTARGFTAAKAEVEALQKMYGWTLKEAEKYGKDKDEDTDW